MTPNDKLAEVSSVAVLLDGNPYMVIGVLPPTFED